MSRDIILCNAQTDQVSFCDANEMFKAIQIEAISCKHCKHIGRGGCPVNFVDVDFLCNQWMPREGWDGP